MFWSLTRRKAGEGAWVRCFDGDSGCLAKGILCLYYFIFIYLLMCIVFGNGFKTQLERDSIGPHL